MHSFTRSFRFEGRAIQTAVLVISVLVGGAALAGSAKADHGNNSPSPDLGYVFQNGNISGWAVADDHTPNGSVYEDRISDWNNQSEIKPTKGYAANHSSNRIHFWQESLGTNGSLGLTYTYSIENYGSLQPCFNAFGGLSGLCNKSNHRATYSDIDLNHDLMADGAPYGTFLERNHTVGHELGHVFGISHLVCSDANVGIMKITGCGNVQAFVQYHDILDANRLY